MTGPSASPRPRVLVDGYFIDREYGFGRYVRELVYALDRHAPGIDLVVAVPPRGEQTLRGIVRRAEVVVAPERFNPLWEQWTIPLLARRHGCRLVHFPYQTMAFAWPARRSIVTLHDMIPFGPENLLDWSLPRFAGRYRRVTFGLLGHRAAQVVAVSAQTGRLLMQRFGRDSAVVGNSVEQFVVSHPRRIESTSAYLLHRGSAGPHKNTRRVVEAFRRVRESRPDLELRIFGVEPGSPFAAEIAAPGIELLARMSDADLAAQFHGAIAVVMPSLEEGFGLSILEAFGFRVPLITSDRPPMNEIASEATACLVDPTSTTTIADAIERVCDDTPLRLRLIEAGAARFNTFGSQRAAETLAHIYEAALDPATRNPGTAACRFTEG